jgi:hypothetical protein
MSLQLEIRMPDQPLARERAPVTMVAVMKLRRRGYRVYRAGKLHKVVNQQTRAARLLDRHELIALARSLP